jgi:zinc protease
MTQEKLDNQRDVVKNERRWRVDNQPYGDWDERLQTMVYPPDHPYHHSVIGSMEDLDAASLEDVETFFRTYYRPNNAVLTLCGDFEEDRALELSEKWFGEIPAGDPVPPIPGRTDIPTVLEKPGPGGGGAGHLPPAVYKAYRIPPYGDDAWYAAGVAAHVLAYGRAARLNRRWCGSGGWPRTWWPSRSPSWWAPPCSWSGPPPGPGVDPDDAGGGAGRGDRRAGGGPPEEVTRAVRLIEAGQLDELQRVDERADQLSMFTCLFDDPGRINTELDRIRAVTADRRPGLRRRHLGPSTPPPSSTCPSKEAA